MSTQQATTPADEVPPPGPTSTPHVVPQAAAPVGEGLPPDATVGSLTVGQVKREVERARDLERFLTFVDAIIAIAITLLVLPLVEIAGDAERLSVSDLVVKHQGQLFSFFLSFFVIAQSWFAQHNIVRTLVVQDKVVTRCLMAWALTIVVLPVPTALVAGSENGDKTEVLYIGTMALSTLALTAAAWRMATTPAIRDGGTPPSRVDSVTILVIMVLALVASLVVPGAGYLPLLFLLLSGRVSETVRARRRKRHARVAATEPEQSLYEPAPGR